MKFVKMHGAGNDYIFVDCLDGIPENLKKNISKICDRHYGVGSDGIIFLMTSAKADFKMRIFNPDGSEAEMCGNAIRCLGKYLYDSKYASSKQISIETLCGIKKILVHTTDQDIVEKVTVDMGIPSFKYRETDEQNVVMNFPIEAGGVNFLFTPVSMGNPHIVIFVDEIDSFDVEKYGKILESHRFFPNKTNVEFVKVLDRRNIKMRVYERGVGETLACGTGASASVVASVLNDYTDRQVFVHLKGGELEVNFHNKVFLTGDANFVFKGDYSEGKDLLKEIIQT